MTKELKATQAEIVEPKLITKETILLKNLGKLIMDNKL